MKKIEQQQKIYLLLGLFVGSLLTATFLGSKITAFDLPAWLALMLNTLFWPVIFLVNAAAATVTKAGLFDNTFLAYDFFSTIHVSVGILSVPVMFLITDAIAEVFGKKLARQFVQVGITVMIFAIGITALSVWLPADPTREWFSQETYSTIFGSTVRILIASIIAFMVAQYHDIWAFEFWKQKTQGKFLWLRNNLSTIVSQFLDSIIFMFIAFYHVTPLYTATFIFSLVIPYWIFKILFALLDTPLLYWMRKWLKN